MTINLIVWPNRTLYSNKGDGWVVQPDSYKETKFRSKYWLF